MLRKVWNTLRHGDSKTKSFLVSVAVLAVVTVVLFGIGALIFKRLKVHFADVL